MPRLLISLLALVLAITYLDVASSFILQTGSGIRRPPPTRLDLSKGFGKQGEKQGKMKGRKSPKGGSQDLPYAPKAVSSSSAPEADDALAKLQLEANTLAAALEEAKKSSSVSEEGLAFATEQLGVLQSELEASRVREIDLGGTVREAEEEAAAMKEMVEKVRGELQSELEASKAREEALNSNVKKVEQERDGLGKMVEDVRKQGEERAREVQRKLTSDFESIRTSMTLDFKDRLQTLTTERDSLSSKLSASTASFRSQLKALEEDKSNLERGRADDALKIKELEARLDSYESEVFELDRDLEAASSDIEKLKLEQEADSKKYDALSREFADLGATTSEQISSLKSERDELRLTVSSVRSDLELERAQAYEAVKRLEDKIAVRQEVIESYEVEVAEVGPLLRRLRVATVSEVRGTVSEVRGRLREGRVGRAREKFRAFRGKVRERISSK